MAIADNTHLCNSILYSRKIHSKKTDTTLNQQRQRDD